MQSSPPVHDHLQPSVTARQYPPVTDCLQAVVTARHRLPAFIARHSLSSSHFAASLMPTVTTRQCSCAARRHRPSPPACYLPSLPITSPSALMQPAVFAQHHPPSPPFVVCLQPTVTVHMQPFFTASHCPSVARPSHRQSASHRHRSYRSPLQPTTTRHIHRPSPPVYSPSLPSIFA